MTKISQYSKFKTEINEMQPLLCYFRIRHNQFLPLYNVGIFLSIKLHLANGYEHVKVKFTGP